MQRAIGALLLLIFRLVNFKQDSAGLTALMVAAPVSEGCDTTGNNVMHYVARRTVTLLDIIAAGEKYDKSKFNDIIVKLLNNKVNNNQTPLPLACEDDKPDMMMAMLSLGADLNILAEMPGHSEHNHLRAEAEDKEYRYGANIESAGAHVFDQNVNLVIVFG